MTAASSAAVTRALAEFLADTTYDDLPSTVIDDAKRAALDWLGSALAGALEPPARMAQRVALALGASSEATVLSAGQHVLERRLAR